MTWRIDLKRSVLQSAREFIPEIAHWSMTADDDAIYSSSTEPSVEYRLLIYPHYEVAKISEPNTNRWHIAGWTKHFVSHARTRGRRIDQWSWTMKTWPVRFRCGQYWSFDSLTVNYPFAYEAPYALSRCVSHRTKLRGKIYSPVRRHDSNVSIKGKDQ